MNYQTGTTLGGTCHPPWDSPDGMVRISSMGAICTEIEHLTIRLNLFKDVVKFHKPTNLKTINFSGLLGDLSILTSKSLKTASTSSKSVSSFSSNMGGL